MRLIWAISTYASALSTVLSQSRASRRQRPSHLRGSTSKPSAVS
jgi:hypothetical protein